MRNRKKKWYAPVVFWFCAFLLLFFYLQKQLSFHFFYIEQEQLFLWNHNYFLSFIKEPAGLIQWFTEFCVQFFILPYVGALFMSALFILIGILTSGIIKRMAPHSNLFIFSLLPIIFLLYVHFDLNYYYRGTMAYMLLLWVLYGYFGAKCTQSVPIRLFYATVFGVILFWCAGAVAFLFVVCVFLWEVLHPCNHVYKFLFPLFLISGLGFGAVYTSMIGEYRLLFLPDGYFENKLHPSEVGIHGVAIYFSWIFLPVLLLLGRFLQNRSAKKGRKKYTELLLQLCLAAFLFWFGIDKFAYRYSDFYKELDYYMRNEQWDRITERCNGELRNYMYKCCLNVALAEKGILAERMFSYDQAGIQSIYLPWDRVTNVSVLLSDIYFSMGHIAMAQRMAFEANVSMPNSNGVRMIKRLIQTNLIYGSYPVAQKYIDLLEQTIYYRKWAREHRHFLWNEMALEHDSLLGIKRKCILPANMPIELQELHIELAQIAEQNPAHRATFQYAGAICLLSKKIPLFQELIETHYGTSVLPSLPKSYQEAVVIMFENDPSKWEQYHVSVSVIQRFNAFKSQVLANRNNQSALAGLLKKSFGDTYWYYYMFI